MSLNVYLIMFFSHYFYRNMMENLETNRFGSNIRIFNAMDGTLMMNTTNQLTDFYSRFNDSLYQMRRFSRILLK